MSSPGLQGVPLRCLSLGVPIKDIWARTKWHRSLTCMRAVGFGSTVEISTNYSFDVLSPGRSILNILKLGFERRCVFCFKAFLHLCEGLGLTLQNFLQVTHGRRSLVAVSTCSKHRFRAEHDDVEGMFVAASKPQP